MIKDLRRYFHFILLGLASVLLLSIGVRPACAQSSSAKGRLEGEVLDAKDLPVASAVITARNASTGESLTQQSDDRGHFLFLYLAPGKYEVSIEKGGFTHLVLSDVVINVGTTTTLHPQLAIGQVETKVNVTAEAPIVDTVQSALATVVSRESIENLPLNGRNFTDFG
jgi:hypothetical protein